MSKNLYSRKQAGRTTAADDPQLGRLTKLIGALKSDTARRPGNTFVTPAQSATAISLESVNDADFRELQSAVENLSASMEQYLSDAELGTGIHNIGINAGVVGATIAANPIGVSRLPVLRNQPAMENVSYVNPTGADMFYEAPNKVALEAYDDRDNRHVTTYSTAYNLLASRQGPFAEMFFPTVLVTHDQVGFETTLRISSVMSDIKVGLDGAVTDWKKKNLIRAAIDPTIFATDSTKIYPVHREASKDKFVDVALVEPKDVDVEGEAVLTAPLKMDKKVSLIGISQTEALIKTGTPGIEDAVDTSVTLRALYLKLSGEVNGAPKTEVFKIETKRLPTAVWNHSLQGLDRQMALAFATTTVRLTKDTKTVGGAASALLATLGERDVRLELGVSGTINLQTSETHVWAKGVSVNVIRDETNATVPLGTGVGKQIVDLIEAGSLIGYDLDAQRVNANRRQRGQILDTVFYNQIYTVPLRSPLSVVRPQQGGEENDASDLATLITATHYKINNAAVDTLLEAADFLEEYCNEKDTFETAPAILGLARFLVTAHFRRQTLDVRTVVQSLNSSERFQDIQQAMVGVLRDLVFNMYRDSGWQAAADALAGGNGGKPTVLIGTDPVIARYLTVSGDTRLLGDAEFPVQVESTLNERMTGKIVIAFGQQGNTGAPNPMHFGNMAYRPENPLVLPTHRNGSNSKELMVTPSYLHVVNLPCMIVLDVVGISEVATGLVAVPTKEVA